MVLALNLFRRHSLLLRLGIVVFLFSILLYNVRPHEILIAFSRARPIYLCVAIAFMAPSLFLQICKWNYLLGTIRPRPTLRHVVYSLIGGFFLGAVSPARTGELARGFLIPGHSKLKIASLTVLDKGFNHAITYTAAFVSLFLALPWPLKLIPLAMEIVLVVTLANINRLRPSIERALRSFSTQQTASNTLALFDALSRRTVWVMIGFSVAFFLTYTIQFYFFILCFTDLPFLVAAKTIPLIYAINLVMPITIGDLGVKEMASVKLFAPFGIAGGAAFSASFTQNVITFIIPSIIGGVILAAGSQRRRRAVRSSAGRTAPATEK
jgi:uncharacterized protein (TIRG00374 family)